MDVLAQAQTVISLVGLLAAGYFFLLRREFFPRAQFELSMRLLGERQNELLLELGASVKNVGLVRHTIKRFTFSLRGLDVDEPWIKNSEKIDLIDFPRAIQRGVWVRKKYTTLVEPGVEQRFYYLVKIAPSNIEYLNLYSEIVYAAIWAPPHSAAITRSVVELRKEYSLMKQIP